MLLADLQFTNAIRDLLGEAAIEPDHAPDARTKPFAKKGVVAGTSLVHARLARATYAAESIEGRFEQVTGCAPDGDDACAKAFLTRFAQRAFRRPMDAAELDNLWSVYGLGRETSYERGVSLAVEAILASPSFSYRTELGDAADGDIVKLTAHETASELAFFLTDSLPDEELAAAADSGALNDPDELTRQVERLLEKPETRRSLSTTLIAAWGLSNLFGTVKDPGLFPEYTPALQASMFHETELLLDELLWNRGADVSTLLTSRETFVNGPLAEVYGVEHAGAEPEEFAKVTLPADERAGVLTQPGLLAALSRTDNTSVVARGLFVRGALLCLDKIPSPPEALAGAIQDLLAADMTERERADARAGNASCAGCHRQFDPFGLLLEHYDPVGRYRVTLDGEPIDGRVDLTGLGDLEGVYSSAVELADAVAETDGFAACVARHLLTYGTDDEALSPRDCQVGRVIAALPEGQRTLPNLVKAIAVSPALTERAKEE
ncbi:hypothetical protein SOCEGT47_084690 [Sorangium cellulosum]|uniref:DUF1592 domain-containing protein n=1 Tax=Sorangium cellulosum TaxID=56 RepID=A0A4P2QDU9_SORCE|nr:DUF1592 domain-containing protein [Sorangium cellulosum]AUX27869.1 hypothetical protein SOCEGT47_084690 [Sorangium cellulosum]